nr:MAG TPA: hypothetical protein [Caudoviricetes sp.]
MQKCNVYKKWVSFWVSIPLKTRSMFAVITDISKNVYCNGNIKLL